MRPCLGAAQSSQRVFRPPANCHYTAARNLAEEPNITGRPKAPARRRGHWRSVEGRVASVIFGADARIS